MLAAVSALVVGGIATLALGFIVIINDRSRAASLYFLLTTVGVFLWAVGIGGFLLGSGGQVVSLVYVQVYYFGAALIATGFLLTSLTFISGRRPVWSDGIVALPITVGAILLFATPGWLISDIDVSSNARVVTLNLQGYAVYVSYFVTYYLVSIVILIRQFLNTRDKKAKRQLLYIVHAYGWSGAIGVYFNLLLPLLGNYSLIWVGPLCVFVFIPILFYAIVKHRLFDIRLAATRSLAYVLSIAAMAGIYFGLAYVASVTLFKGASTAGVSMSPVNIVLALVLALIFQPIKQFFDRVTNTIFYRDRYNTDDFIARLGDVLTSTTQLRMLLKTASDEIATTLKASLVSFVVYRADAGSDVVTNATKTNLMTSSQYDRIQQLVDGVGRPLIVVDELLQERSPRRAAHDSTLIWLQKRRISLVLNLDKLGYVLLGEQKGSGYTRRDVKTLETVRDELIIAIQNARSVQEVREINTHLEQRIETATKELRRTNDKLRKIDETKDEFLSMASHQLRTPLTSIKGYISMLLDGDAGEMSDQQKKLLKEAFSSSERMVRLIGDFLNVSRLQTGKFVIERKPTNLAELVQGEVDAIASLATTRTIQLSYKGPRQFPTMQLDEDKIQQVVMNFIDNAIYYSRPKSTIVVRLVKDEKFATLEVHDHGIGVPKEALEKLFTKFFRAENARRQRPDGTGVGLYLAKRVIQGHGGELIVESVEGKGSVFGFRLPLA